MNIHVFVVNALQKLAISVIWEHIIEALNI